MQGSVHRLWAWGVRRDLVSLSCRDFILASDLEIIYLALTGVVYDATCTNTHTTIHTSVSPHASPENMTWFVCAALPVCIGTQ